MSVTLASFRYLTSASYVPLLVVRRGQSMEMSRIPTMEGRLEKGDYSILSGTISSFVPTLMPSGP